MLITQEQYAPEVPPSAWAIKYRQPVSIAVVLTAASLLLSTAPSWPETGLLGQGLDALGFLLVVIAAFGRIWSALYISGYKEDRIVTEGPYALVRNPLYVCSFIGAIGLGLATRHLAILALIAGAFLLYYPLVVLAEERNLLLKFGQVYQAYTARVPRFLPRRLQWVEPDIYPVRPRHVRRSLQEIIWFFWSFLILHLMAGLDPAAWLPLLTLWRQIW